LSEREKPYSGYPLSFERIVIYVTSQSSMRTTDTRHPDLTTAPGTAADRTGASR
jgi:hypothetical protein